MTSVTAVRQDAEQIRARLDAELWQMTQAERVEAMWCRQLTPYQLQRWSARAPHEVPLLGGEFAYITIDTPEWAEASQASRDNVVYMPQRSQRRAAA